MADEYQAKPNQGILITNRDKLEAQQNNNPSAEKWPDLECKKVMLNLSELTDIENLQGYSIPVDIAAYYPYVNKKGTDCQRFYIKKPYNKPRD